MEARDTSAMGSSLPGSLARSLCCNKWRRTFELFVERTLRDDREGRGELFEDDCAIAVAVKHVEGVVCDLAHHSRGEEPLVEDLEFLLADAAFWIVSHESDVPVCESISRSGHRERRTSMKDGIGSRRDACQDMSSSRGFDSGLQHCFSLNRGLGRYDCVS